MVRPVPIAAAVLASMCIVTSAIAQTARAVGVVRDTNGRPIKGATIRAENPEAYPRQITSTTDNKGRWAMIGLRTGTWTFLVEAPGFTKVSAPAPIRVGSTAPMTFTLARDPGPLPGALDRNIMAQLAAANTLRDQGQYDQAIAAYQELHSKNPKLSALNLSIAGVYRKKASLENDPATRRALLERAINSYNELLKSDETNERAKSELALTQAEAATR